VFVKECDSLFTHNSHVVGRLPCSNLHNIASACFSVRFLTEFGGWSLIASWLKFHCAAVSTPPRGLSGVSFGALQGQARHRRVHLAVVWAILEVSGCCRDAYCWQKPHIQE
jgi:hypothetical protein